MAQLLEFGMLICFGSSWPLALIKLYKSRTIKGTSIYFVFLILIGYALGISYKVVSGNINYVIFAYIFNFTIVFVYLLVYFRNYRIENKK